MQKVIPFLWFDNNLEEAMNFYTSIFKKSSIKSIKRNEENGKVFTATFQLEGQEFYALNGGPQFKFTPAISFFVRCKTQKEVNNYWEKLSDGGEKSKCGWLKDKYGISWQIIPDVLGEMLGDSDREKANKVMNSMLKMDKINIKVLKKAYQS